jgi:Do/DeqQ family serine protease
MRNPVTLFLVVTFLCGLIGLQEAPASGLPAEVPSLAPMLETVLPGVVSIAIKGHMPVEQSPLFADPFFRRFFNIPNMQQPTEREFQAAGSGVVVDAANGYVLTNNHMVERAEEITVTLSDGRNLDGQLIGTDPETDIAVVQIPADGLAALHLGDSDQLRVGDYVVAVGNPFGLEQTVTAGIVSALGRSGLGIEGYENFIQTDASINPGNSGGALVDLRGDLIGINSAIIGPSGGNVGIGFAIPINMARKVMDQLIAHGKVSRGQLGVMTQDLTPELAGAFGVEVKVGALVAQVTPEGPADQAGLEAGDVVTAVNGEPVRNSAEFRNRIGLLPVDTEVVLDIIRGGGASTLTAHLVEAVPDIIEVSAAVPALMGVTLGVIAPDSPLYGHVSGASVLDVTPQSRAAEVDLEAGDVIVSVNKQRVQSPEDVVNVASHVSGTLLLQVVRGDQMGYIAIP